MGKKRARFDWSADPDDPALREVVERESRSTLKQHLEVIADLVRDIIAMPPARRAELPLEPELLAEVDKLANTPPSPALKRQMNYVKRLLSDVDVDEMRRVMEGDSPRQAMLREADRWRTRLRTEGNDALAAFLDAYPRTDRQRLRSLLRSDNADRALFDAIVEAIEGESAP